MRFDIITIFPDFFRGTLDHGIVHRARKAGLIDVHVHDLRQFTHDRHRTVDDRPFGGGEGMVLKPEPLFEAVESLSISVPQPANGYNISTMYVVLTSASGKLLRQPAIQRLAALERIVLLCGRYEGVDERVAQHLVTEELSIGDFVLSGGELAAALVLDAVTRLVRGALGNEASSVRESFSEVPRAALREVELRPVVPERSKHGDSFAFSTAERFPVLLDWPHYTRPAVFRQWPVPDVLLSGNHEEIQRWRYQMAIEKTQRNRPDLLGSMIPSAAP